MSNDSSTQEDGHLDLAIVGAGIYGIQAARTYLELHPMNNVAVFEASEHIGGVWSAGETCKLSHA